MRDQDEAVWKSWTEGAPLSIEASYRGYESVFTVEAIRDAEAERAQAGDPRRGRALLHLKSYLAGEYLSRGLAPFADAIAHLEASMTFTLGEAEYPYRNLERLLANEKSAKRRRELYAAATSAVERLSQSIRRKDERLAELLTEVGYPSYEAYGSEIRQADPERLWELADAVLEATEPAYLQAMDRLARKELGVELAHVHRADLPRLFRPQAVDAEFPKESLLPRAAATLQGLGVELSALKNLRLDLAETKGKNPRPLSLAVRIPEDVRISILPRGGVRDQADLFHELGHALHHALSSEPSFELSKLGNITVSEAYAFLLEDLVEDPDWLAEHTGLTGDRLAEYLWASTAHKLFLLRRAAGAVIYGLHLHRDQDADPQELYREVSARTYRIPVTPEDAARYLVESEEFYQSADDLRAWVLAAQLQATLKAKFGPRWWKSREAGAFMKALWAKANALSAEELAQHLGEPRLRPNALFRRLSSNLQLPIAAEWQPRPWGRPLEVTDGGAPPAADGGASEPDAPASPDAGVPDAG